MKKLMMIATIGAALAFFVSVIAVAPSGAAETTKTQTKQKPQKKETLSDSSAVTKPHKPTFWDLEVDHCIINNQGACKNASVHVKNGAVSGQCFYNVKTPVINTITKEDADYWGKGKSYTIHVSILRYIPGIPAVETGVKKEDVSTTPQFAWGDVLAWKRSGLGNTSKTWKWMMPFPFNWNISTSCVEVLQYSFKFNVDSKNDISESDEKNNQCGGTIFPFCQ